VHPRVVYSLYLCNTGITVTLVLVASHASCAKPFAVENTLAVFTKRAYVRGAFG